ncbi:MAG: hypothetical protein N3B14_06790 [Thermoleophilia bacterium]|nr:hypothetical protein [Thermoleophilia bacterium]
MTVEYLVLGIMLVVLGGVQTWLRHGPKGRALRRQQEELARRRAEALVRESGRAGEVNTMSGRTRYGGIPGANRAWTAWTAILGGVSIALGVLLVVLGVLGR